jgi:hypothetical protein
MRSRTVDIGISGLAGIAVGVTGVVGLLFAVGTALNTDVAKLGVIQRILSYLHITSAHGGDSPILIAGGSMNIFSKQDWTALDAGHPLKGASTPIGTGLNYNYIILDGVIPMDGTKFTSASWFGIAVPWSIYLHGRYSDGTVLKLGNPNPDGLKLCQTTKGTGASLDCDPAGTFNANQASLIPASTDAAFYLFGNYGSTGLGDGAGLFLRRYNYTGGTAACAEALGGLCEHIGQIDVTIQTAPIVNASFRCVVGACSVYVGGYK